MPDLFDQLAAAANRREPDTAPRFDALVARRRTRDRRRLAAAGGLAAAVLAGTAALAGPALVGDRPAPDELVPAASPDAPQPTGPVSTDPASCPSTPRYVPNPNGDGSLIDTDPGNRGTGMPDRVWEAVVAEAPFPPAGPRPTNDVDEVAFGSYRPTQHGFVTNTAVPLPPSAPMFTVWGQSAPCADPATGSVLEGVVGRDGIEGPAQGWGEGAQAAVIDRRPSYYQIVLVQNGASVYFMNMNMETPTASEDLRDWAVRVSHRLAADGAAQPAPKGRVRSAPYRVQSVSPDRRTIDVLAAASPCSEAKEPVVTDTRDGLRVDVRLFEPPACRASLVYLRLSVRLPRALGLDETILGQCTPGETTVERRQCPRDIDGTADKPQD